MRVSKIEIQSLAGRVLGPISAFTMVSGLCLSLCIAPAAPALSAPKPSEGVTVKKDLSQDFLKPKPVWALRAGDIAPDGSGPIDLESLPGGKWTKGAPTVKMPASKVYIESTKGEIQPGIMQGPTAFAQGPDGTTWVADTLNSRILSVPDKGSSKVIIDLAELKGQQGLARLPLPIDLAFGGEGFPKPPAKAVASDYVVWIADAANNRVLCFDITGKFIRALGKTGKGPGEFRQINRIHCDAMGRIFIEDLTQGLTVCLNSDGSHYLSYKQTSIEVDRFGNILQVIMDEDTKSRRICLYDENGNLGQEVATIQANDPIQYVRLVGFDDAGLLHISWDTVQGRWYQSIEPTGKLGPLFHTPDTAEGMDTLTPEWVLANGSVRSLKATARGIVVMEVTPALR